MKQPKYTIERHEHGLLVTGRLPDLEITLVGKLAESLGYEQVDSLIAGEINQQSENNVIMALGSRGSLDQWRKELGIKEPAKLDDEVE